MWEPSPISFVDLKDGNRILKVNGVIGWLLAGEIKYFIDLGKSLPPAGSYLEIGSFMGLSSVLVAKGLRDSGNETGKIFCVDTWEGSVEHQHLDVVLNGELHNIFIDNIQRTGSDKWIQMCRGTSLDKAKDFKDGSLDIVFIDGDHTYEGCYQDLTIWFPKVKEGGRLIGHDAMPQISSWCDVYRAVCDFAGERNLTFTIIPPPQCHYTWEINFK